MGRAAATRGILLRLREQLEFLERGRELLKMKRDHLASEVNKLLSELAIRGEVEDKLKDAYESLKSTYSTLGYSATLSEASTVDKVEVDVKPYSIMGVVVSRISVKRKPDFNNIYNMYALETAEKLASAIESIMKLAETEFQIERLTMELMMTNRKVNALEKRLIPSLMELIRYIEDKLEEEMLDEFFKAKLVRTAIRGRR